MTKVSIALPVRNCETTLDVCIKSMLMQTYQDWELFILDDGSTDGTLDIARNIGDPRLRVLSDGARRGLVARLNQAIALSTGEFFARMDGDDISYPDRLARQVAFLEGHPEVDLVGTGMLVFGDDGRAIGKRMPEPSHDEICRFPSRSIRVAHPTFCGKLSWFRIFQYRPDALLCEDQDLLLRARHTSRYANVTELLLGYREPRLVLKKQVSARFNHSRTMWNQFRSEGETGLALRAVVGQMAKMCADTAAISTGLHARLLKHRAAPLTETELLRWDEVRRILDVPGSASSTSTRKSR